MSEQAGGLDTLFPESARAKIVDALLSSEHPDLNVTEIAEEAGVARSTVYEHIHDLEDMGLVVATRPNGGGSMFAVDEEEPIIRAVESLREVVHDD